LNASCRIRISLKDSTDHIVCVFSGCDSRGSRYGSRNNWKGPQPHRPLPRVRCQDSRPRAMRRKPAPRGNHGILSCRIRPVSDPAGFRCFQFAAAVQGNSQPYGSTAVATFRWRGDTLPNFYCSANRVNIVSFKPFLLSAPMSSDGITPRISGDALRVPVRGCNA